MCVLKDVCIYLVAVFAACRLNRLIVRDIIAAPFRSWLKKRKSFAGRFAYAAVLCYWCTGIWTAASTAALAHWSASWSWTLYPLTMLSAAWLAFVIADWLEANDQDA